MPPVHSSLSLHTTTSIGAPTPPILDTGAWDPITALYLKITKDEALLQLQSDTIRVANGEDLSAPVEIKKLEEDSNPAEEEFPKEAVDIAKEVEHEA
jgi:hypothetical protein